MKIHIVKKGDSLYSISQKYNVPLEEILKLNPGIANPDVIDVGMKIKIPSMTTGTGGMEIMHQHVVKQGDTLWKLSKAWGIPLADMIKANPQLKNPNVLLTGEVVNIPKAGSEGSGELPTIVGSGDSSGQTAQAPMNAYHPLHPLSVMQNVQGWIGGKKPTGQMPGKVPTGQMPEKVPTAPVSPVPPMPLPNPVPPNMVSPAPVEPAPAPPKPTMPIEKPVDNKPNPIHSEYNPNVDLFKQYGIPATEATSLYDLPKVPSGWQPGEMESSSGGVGSFGGYPLQQPWHMGPNVGPNMGPNMTWPNMGPNVGPNMGPNMTWPNMGPNVGPNVDPNVGPNVGPNMGPNMTWPNMEGPGAQNPNASGPNMMWPNMEGPNASGPNMMWPNMEGPNASGPNMMWPNMEGPNVGGPNMMWPNAIMPNMMWPNMEGPGMDGPNAGAEGNWPKEMHYPPGTVVYGGHPYGNVNAPYGFGPNANAPMLPAYPYGYPPVNVSAENAGFGGAGGSYGFPTWPQPNAPKKDEDCGCGGRQENESGTAQTSAAPKAAKTKTASNKKGAKKASIRTVKPRTRSKKSSNRSSMPWINR